MFKGVLIFCFKCEFVCVSVLLFCILFSCSSVFLCSRASVPLSLFYLSVLVSCSEFVVLFYIRFQVLVLFEFWFCSSVHDLFRSWFSVSFFQFCSVFVFFVFCFRFQVRVQVLYH